ncbi:MAG: 2-oxoacid:acceptor oxidoreductase family protein [Phycisphaerales bacterium]|nr:2-oxoacid:acceptor oxidoreductase family protein [Phycisphaerales bacterium]
MKDPVQIRFSGSGGQGLITAGVILAEAAMLDGRNVVQTQTYGPEARLGSSRAEVIISKGTIAYPEVTVPDVLLCLSQEAARKYAMKVGPETVVMLDSTNIGEDIPASGRVLRLAITDAAVKAGGRVVANTVSLALMNAIVPVVSRGALSRAIEERVPAKFRELNRRAQEAGEALAREVAAAV